MASQEVPQQVESDSSTPLVVEITRADAMRSFLTEDIFSDLTLRSEDGMAIRANRCMLAARSPVFRRMLFGEFAEARKSEIAVGYKGDVLSSVVEFIYTELATLLGGSHHKNHTREIGEDLVPSLLSLVDAADFFAIPELRRKTEEFARDSMTRNLSLVGVFLSACESHGVGATAGVIQWAHSVIAANTKAVTKEGSLHLITSSQLQDVLRMDALRDQELHRFLLIQAWANMGQSGMSSAAAASSTSSPAEADGSNDESSRQSRKRSASELTKELSLEKIGPRDLSVSVEPSGLVTTDQILHAYKVQALSSCYRRSLVWQSSNDNACDFRSHFREDKVELLSCETLTTGVHKWSILVEAENRYAQLWLGIAHTGFEIDCEEWLGDQEGGWVYGDQGSVFHGGLGLPGRPTFGGRSTVTFTLDLTEDGVLSASVDGNPEVQLFSSLHDDVDYARGRGGFVPAVSVSSFPNGRVRFLGFSPPES